MDDILGFLCAAGITLAIIAAVGHGLWLLAAAVGRLLFRSPPVPGSPPRACPLCGDPKGVVGPRCRTCGAPATISEQQLQRAELLATRRRLNRWLDRRQLPAEIHALALQLLDGDEQQLKSSPAAAAVPAVPLSPSASPSAKVPLHPLDLPTQAPPAPAPPDNVPSPYADEPILVADLVEGAEHGDSTDLAALLEGASPPAPLRDLRHPSPSPRAAQPAPPPRRPLADMLQAFMEESNIRWVEIICGVLIVVSAVGLVVSLRSTLQDTVPYFPALSFMTVTAAIHAVGIYSLRRWNLQQTSRGVLVIATLLVPLNFLASIMLSGTGEQQRPITDPFFIAAVVIGTASFATMNYFASRALLPHGWWRLMIAILGTSIGQLVINRLHPGESTPRAAASLLAIPVGSFLFAAVLLLLAHVRRTTLGRRAAGRLFLELGLSVFALAAPVALYLARATTLASALSDLSPLLSIAACALLASGLLVHQRATRPALAAYRLVGTTLVVLGAGLMLTMAAFAWPQLGLLVAVGLINFALLTCLALFARLPLLHVAAVGCLGLAYLSLFHIWRGPGPFAGSPGSRLVQATFSGASGLALTLFATLAAAAGGVLWYRRRREDGGYYLLASGGLALLCIAIGTYAGFLAPRTAEPDLATPILLYFALAALATSWITRRTEVTALGSLLLLLGFGHALCVNSWLADQFAALGWIPTHPLLLSLLGHSLVASLLSVVAAWLVRDRSASAVSPTTPSPAPPTGHAAAVAQERVNSGAVPLGWSAIATSAAAALLALAVSDQQYATHALYLLGASLPWLGFAWLRYPVRCFAFFQTLASLALAYATTAVCSRLPGWRNELWSAQHLHPQLAVLAAGCGAWSLLRRASMARAGLARFWPATLSVDQVLLAALTTLTLLLALAGCLPGIALELGWPRALSATEDPAALYRQWHAPGAWGALALVLLAWLANLWQSRSRDAMVACVTATAAAPLLAAGGFDDSQGVASAVRWLFALFGATWCLPACYLGGRAQRRASVPSPEPLFAPASPQIMVSAADAGLPARFADAMRVVSLVISASAILLVTTAAVLAVAAGFSPGGPAAESFFDQLGAATSYAAPLVMLVGILAAYALRESRSEYALWASLVLQYAISLACLLPVFSSGAPIDSRAIAELLQWNFVGLGLFTTAWVAALPWLEAIPPASCAAPASAGVEPTSTPPSPIPFPPPSSPLPFPRGEGQGEGFPDGRTASPQPPPSPIPFPAPPCPIPFPSPPSPLPFPRGEGQGEGFPENRRPRQGPPPPRPDVSTAVVRSPRPAPRRQLLAVQIGLLTAAQLAIVLWTAWMLFADPTRTWAAIDALGRWPSYLGLAAAVVGLGWLTWRAPAAQHVHALCLAGLVLIHLLAASVHAADVLSRWWGHHTMAAGRIVLATAVVGWLVARVGQRRGPIAEPVWTGRTAAVGWTGLVVGLIASAALRSAAADPWRPAWPTLVMASAALLTGALGVSTRRQWFAFAATALSGMAASVLLAGLFAAHPLRDAPGVVSLHVIAIATAAVAWLSWEVYFQRRGDVGLDPRFRFLPVHHVVGIVAISVGVLHAVLGALVICLSERMPRLSSLEMAVSIGAWLSLLTFYVGSLWDRRAVVALPGLYVWSMGVALFAIDQLAVSPPVRVVVMLAWMAAQVAVSGWIWSWGSKLVGIGYRVGIPNPVDGLRRTERWLPAVTLFLAAGVTVLSVLVVLTHERRELRVATACTPLLLAAGMAGLAQQLRRDAMQLLSLLALTLACALLGWSDIPRDFSDGVQVLRAFRLLMALSAAAFALGVVAVRVFSSESGWRQSARRAAVVVGSLAGVTLLFVLGLEAATFQSGVGAPVETVQLIAVSIVLAGLVVALLSLAVLPGRDPLELSEKGRMAYVYAAQVVAGLLFAHVYLAKPMLFSSTLRPYWPYLVMGLAFAGVGVSEIFQRLGWRVLAEPFQRSGAFLPLIPAIGMWVVHSDSDYSMLLFAVGVLYLLISFSRRSPLAGMAAGVAGNGALWSLLEGTEDLTFSRHPQFWLIPPAVSVLIAAQLNRQRISATQLAAIRYVAVSIIYLSSAAEMLRIGIGTSLWPPVIIVSLAILGVFFGIALRIRAYLYLGTVFVLVGMISMVAHAARSTQHVWPWWAFGIVTGLLILALFGWFEGRRAQMLVLVDRLRQWEK